MKIERLTQRPDTPPLTAESLLRAAPRLLAPAPGSAPRSAPGIALGSIPRSVTPADLAPLIRPAVEAVEARWGVVIEPGDYRIGLNQPPGPVSPLDLPLAPIVSLGEVFVGGRVLPGVSLRRGRIAPPQEGWPAGLDVEVNLLAGWADSDSDSDSGGAPHLVLLAVAAVCAAWLSSPELAATGDPGPAAAVAGQYLELFTPRCRDQLRGRGRGQGGVAWQR